MKYMLLFFQPLAILIVNISAATGIGYADDGDVKAESHTTPDVGYGGLGIIGEYEKEQIVDAINPPVFMNKAATARWIAHNSLWGSLSTINSRERNGAPFANIASFSDGVKDSSTGVIYMLHSSLDASIIDVIHNNLVSFSLSELQTGYCNAKEYDAEDPRCARLSISGRLILVPDDEIEAAKEALYDKHPAMKGWYENGKDHDFRIWKIDIEEIWLVDFFGGAAIVSIDAWNRGTDKEDSYLSPRSIDVQRKQEEKMGRSDLSSSRQ